MNLFNSLSLSSIKDVRHAFDVTPNTLDGEWIYFVDPETFNEVKALYRAMAEVDGNLSLYNVFCKVLKVSRAKNITF